MKKITLLCSLLCISTILLAQSQDPKDTEVWEPVPRIVTAGDVITAPPSDAIILFDGKNLDAWEARWDKGAAAKWDIAKDIMTVAPKAGDIKTRQSFGDIQLHIEWRTPKLVEEDGQGRGNSGVFLQERYEVQILDSYENTTYPNGQAGAVYKQHIPLVNASKGPGEWQTYDIIFTAPRFNKDGIKIVSGRLTVLHNGVLIQNNVEVKGTTEYIGLPKNKAHGDGPIVLQDHGNTMSFRNIWLREL